MSHTSARKLATISFLFLGITSFARAQQVNGVSRNNSPSNPFWQQWASIYGTNLQGTNPFVWMTYPASGATGFIRDLSIIDANTSYQTYWYASPYQINFWPYPQNIYSNRAIPGCVIELGQVQCVHIRVCRSGSCSAVYDQRFEGVPNNTLGN